MITDNSIHTKGGPAITIRQKAGRKNPPCMVRGGSAPLTILCTQCMKRKGIEEFSKRKISKDGLRGYCKKCYHEYETKYRLTHHDQLNKYSRKSRIKNRETIRLRAKKYYQRDRDKILERARNRHKQNILYKNPEKRCADQRKNNKRRIQTISDGYAISLIRYASNLKPCDIPRELIDLKRINLKIKRLLKERKVV